MEQPPKPKYDISKHLLITKHTKITEPEHKLLLEKYNISQKQLPKILKSDPAIQHLDPKVGDVMKIERKSPTAEKITLYREVINGWSI